MGALMTASKSAPARRVTRPLPPFSLAQQTRTRREAALADPARSAKVLNLRKALSVYAIDPEARHVAINEAIKRLRDGRPRVELSAEDRQALAEHERRERTLRRELEATEIGPFLSDLLTAAGRDVASDLSPLGAAILRRLGRKASPTTQRLSAESDRAEAIRELAKTHLSLTKDNRYRSSARSQGFDDLEGLAESAVATAVLEVEAPQAVIYVTRGTRIKHTQNAHGNRPVPLHDLPEEDLFAWVRARARALIEEDLGIAQTKEERRQERTTTPGNLGGHCKSCDPGPKFRSHPRPLTSDGLCMACSPVWSYPAAADAASNRRVRRLGQPEVIPTGSVTRQRGHRALGAGYYSINGLDRRIGFVPDRPVACDPKSRRTLWVLHPERVTRLGDAGLSPWPRVSLDVIASEPSRGAAALAALDVEAAIAPQRAAKVEEIRAMASPQQARLIKEILRTGSTEWAQIAQQMSSSENAVRQLVFQLRAKADATIAPPEWVRPTWRSLLWDDGALARPPQSALGAEGRTA